MPETNVLLTFDLDAEQLWLARDAANADRPITLSQGRYGRKVAAPRILEILAAHDARCTFFIPGKVVVDNPDLVRRIRDEGHEIAHHSWSHSWPLDMPVEEEREEMERAFAAIEMVCGISPVGYRSPAGEMSPNTLGLMKEMGFSYSSNFMDGDRSYIHGVDSAAAGIVEIPIAWHLVDSPFFLYSHLLPGKTMHPPSTVEEYWVTELERLHTEGGAQVTYVMHPQLIGRPARVGILERLLERVAHLDGARILRCDDLAEATRADDSDN